MSKLKGHIQSFIDAMKIRFPMYHYGFYRSGDEWLIWHTNKNEFNDKDFRDFAGVCMCDYLCDNDIYDFNFDYDDSKAISLSCVSRSYQHRSWSYQEIQVCNLIPKSMKEWTAASFVSHLADKAQPIQVNDSEDLCTLTTEYSLAV